MLEKGFFKVAESGGTFIVDTFYNPETKESYTKCVRDYDYADGRRDDDELYYMEINEDVRRIWLHDKGVIFAGDLVKVVKGRKVPVGTVAKVIEIYDWRDRYGRVQTTYAVLDNGMKTNVNNCILHEEV